MLVPVHIWRDFNKPNARLHCPPGHQTLTPKIIRYRRPNTVAALNGNRLAVQVHNGWEVRLHPDDIAALTPVLAMTAHTRLTADTSLSRGDLRVHAESVRIDGTLEARLRGALETVLNRGARA